MVKTLLRGLGKVDEDDHGDPIGLTYKESSFFTVRSNNFKVDKESIIAQKCCTENLHFRICFQLGRVVPPLQELDNYRIHYSKCGSKTSKPSMGDENGHVTSILLVLFKYFNVNFNINCFGFP